MLPIRASLRHLGPLADKPHIFARLVRRIREDIFATHVERDAGLYNWFEGFEKLSSRVQLSGYFISPKFFSGNEQRIRADLQPGALSTSFDIMGATGFAYLNMIRSVQDSCSLHIRRGDFLTYDNPPLYLTGFENYLATAMRYVVERRSGVVFFVFSDDPEWCKQHFADSTFTVHVVSDEEAASTFRDFALMNSCTHNIIANSTFSWWAAYLNSSLESLVIAPSKWDTQGVTPIDEILPSHWVRLSC